ncbi:MAG: hypothetical protein AAFU64_06220 [Bacteroidota bacterium]
MITIKIRVKAENLEQVLPQLKTVALIESLEVEDIDDQNLKPMTATDFYKKINAANLAEQEGRMLSQSEMEKEVTTW